MSHVEVVLVLSVVLPPEDRAKVAALVERIVDAERVIKWHADRDERDGVSWSAAADYLRMRKAGP